MVTALLRRGARMYKVHCASHRVAVLWRGALATGWLCAGVQLVWYLALLDVAVHFPSPALCPPGAPPAVPPRRLRRLSSSVCSANFAPGGPNVISIGSLVTASDDLRVLRSCTKAADQAARGAGARPARAGLGRMARPAHPQGVPAEELEVGRLMLTPVYVCSRVAAGPDWQQSTTPEWVTMAEWCRRMYETESWSLWRSPHSPSGCTCRRRTCARRLRRR